MRSFLYELKRRNVLRAGALYAGAAWALAQGMAQLYPVFGIPDWVVRWFVAAAAIGFPLMLGFSWFYEFTPGGLKRESEIDPADFDRVRNQTRSANGRDFLPSFIVREARGSTGSEGKRAEQQEVYGPFHEKAECSTCANIQQNAGPDSLFRNSERHRRLTANAARSAGRRDRNRCPGAQAGHIGHRQRRQRGN